MMFLLTSKTMMQLLISAFRLRKWNRFQKLIVLLKIDQAVARITVAVIIKILAVKIIIAVVKTQVQNQ